MATQTPPTQEQSPPALPPLRQRLTHFYLLHIVGAIFPLTAALLLYGWRSAALVCLALLSTIIATWIWQRIGKRGPCLHLAHALWLALLLAMMLPAQLFSWHELPTANPFADPWAIVPGAAFLLVFLLWLIGGVGFSRVHPLLLTYLMLVILFGDSLDGRAVLQRPWAARGDILLPTAPPASDDGWIIQRQPAGASQAFIYDETAPQRLTAYTRARKPQRGDWITLDSLLRDSMPPLEDLVIGGHPGPLGTSSAIAVIIGGLFLLYKGLIDYRIPLLLILTAYVAFLVLPVPVVVTPDSAQWRPLITPRAHQDIATILTFANYETLASPLLFAAFFLATSPSVSPSNPRRRKYFAIFAGLLAAGCQLYLSCSFGAYLAVLLASLPCVCFTTRKPT